MNKSSDHCCTLMDKFVKDVRVGVFYSPIFRSYTINLLSSNAVQVIYNCPWCGLKLPYCLDDKYEEILQKEYNIDPYNDEQEKLVPEEFHTDEWWKKRNL